MPFVVSTSKNISPMQRRRLHSYHREVAVNYRRIWTNIRYYGYFIYLFFLQKKMSVYIQTSIKVISMFDWVLWKDYDLRLDGISYRDQVEKLKLYTPLKLRLNAMCYSADADLNASKIAMHLAAHHLTHDCSFRNPDRRFTTNSLCSSGLIHTILSGSEPHWKAAPLV